MNSFSFDRYKNGRVGSLNTTHGNILTPAFVFCGTNSTIKGLASCFIDSSTQIVLCNAFHLQKQAMTIDQLGGIHKFMNWNKPIITDSGGFQIFSLGYGLVSEEIKGNRPRNKNSQLKINEEGVFFKSPINGDQNFISPEVSMETQIKLGVNLAVSFDECTASHCDYDYIKSSMERSHRWETRSLEYFQANKKPHQSLYGIIQGGIYDDLRSISCNIIDKLDFFGIAIGGSLGKTKTEMYNIVKETRAKLGDDRPIHLLGIGKIEDIIELSPFIDTFDCVEPTRIARHGIAIGKKLRLNLKNAKYKTDFQPIDPDCLCLTCQNYSRAYINYLIKSNELAAIQLIIIHNMWTMNKLMEEIREAITNNSLDIVKNNWI